MAVGYDKGLAPRSNRQLTAYVRNLLRYYPKPRNRAQIGRDASAFALSQSKPLMDSIIADANARLSSGRAAIGGLTEQLQSRLGPIAAEQHTADEKAKSDSAAQNAALGEFLHAHAASSAADLAQRSSLMGPLPADQQALLDKASTGVGNSAAGAGVARGGVAYDRLNADANTHEAMARELPALAALAGVNAGKQLGAQVNFQTNEAQGKVRAAIPGLVSSYVSNADRGELARAAAALSLAQGAQGQEIQKGIARQSLGLGLARIAQSDTNSRRSTATTKRGQDYTHADRQAAAKQSEGERRRTRPARRRSRRRATTPSSSRSSSRRGRSARPVAPPAASTARAAVRQAVDRLLRGLPPHGAVPRQPARPPARAQARRAVDANGRQLGLGRSGLSDAEPRQPAHGRLDPR
jgi:hypothetical protein